MMNDYARKIESVFYKDHRDNVCIDKFKASEVMRNVQLELLGMIHAKVENELIEQMTDPYDLKSDIELRQQLKWLAGVKQKYYRAAEELLRGV